MTRHLIIQALCYRQLARALSASARGKNRVSPANQSKRERENERTASIYQCLSARGRSQIRAAAITAEAIRARNFFCAASFQMKQSSLDFSSGRPDCNEDSQTSLAPEILPAKCAAGMRQGGGETALLPTKDGRYLLCMPGLLFQFKTLPMVVQPSATPTTWLSILKKFSTQFPCGIEINLFLFKQI